LFSPSSSPPVLQSSQFSTPKHPNTPSVWGTTTVFGCFRIPQWDVWDRALAEEEEKKEVERRGNRKGAEGLEKEVGGEVEEVAMTSTIVMHNHTVIIRH
jgi:hypothetical protein